MWYNIYKGTKYIKKGEEKVSWELIETNPVEDMFRLNELYDEEKDGNIKYTEEELEIIEMLLKKSGDL